MPQVLNFEVVVQRQSASEVDTSALMQSVLTTAKNGIGPEFELWTISKNYQNGKFDVEKSGRTMRLVSALNPKAKSFLRVGDVVLVGFYQRDRQRPYIKADAPLGRG